MKRVFVHGQGAVSPAGWGAAELRSALEAGQPLPIRPLMRPGWSAPLAVRPVPEPPVKPSFLAHARLRRASPMTHYAVAAALEAIGGDAGQVRSGSLRLGIVTCTMNGGLSYSRRFYEETLRDPATASPLLFPETVFNAPASHLSAYLETRAVNYSFVGDGGTFLQGLAVAGQWLQDGVADACVVIGAEEIDWTAADALRLFDRTAVHACGAGAIYLKTDSAAVELAAVTDSFPPIRSLTRGQAVQRMRAQLPPAGPKDFLCGSENWPDWPGIQASPAAVLGEGFAAAAAWQNVLACDYLQRCPYEAATVAVTGPHRQAIGARFVKYNV